MTSRVETATNLFDYFHGQVERAQAQRGSGISEDTRLYLVTLLADRARADAPEAPEDTLAELHARAANAPPARQARTYRELGDRALYLLGYFAESLSRRLVGPDYYADMGSAAYHRVDILFKAVFADAFGPVFRELARDFRDCAGIVSDVRDAHKRDRPDDVVVLYERWLETGDPETAEKLTARGVILPKARLFEG